MRNKFCIAHTEYNRYRPDAEFGVVQVIPLRTQLPAGLGRSRPHMTKAQRYHALPRPEMRLPREVKNPVEGYPLALATSDGTVYLQRRGIRYRVDKLIQSGRVTLPVGGRGGR